MLDGCRPWVLDGFRPWVLDGFLKVCSAAEVVDTLAQWFLFGNCDDAVVTYGSTFGITAFMRSRADQLPRCL